MSEQQPQPHNFDSTKNTSVKLVVSGNLVKVTAQKFGDNGRKIKLLFPSVITARGEMVPDADGKFAPKGTKITESDMVELETTDPGLICRLAALKLQQGDWLEVLGTVELWKDWDKDAKKYKRGKTLILHRVLEHDKAAKWEDAISHFFGSSSDESDSEIED